MLPLTTRLFSEPRPYTGVELSPHFILSKLKIEGSALIAFEGPCEVKTESLVDWEDRLADDFIRSKAMIHFLGEFFGIGLREGFWMQRLLVSLAQNALRNRGFSVIRSGDDLFIQNRKLSVSIVTASPVSVLLHLGINVDSAGAPVPAIGLDDLSLNSHQRSEWVQELLNEFQSEVESVFRACTKVRAVL